MNLLHRKIILVSGKGGVGRTTVAAAMARSIAESGRRTLLTEIGYEGHETSALGQLFGRPSLSSEPVSVGERLFLGQLCAHTGHVAFLRSILPSRALIEAALRSKAINKFLIAAPSFHEMGVFYHLLTLMKARLQDGRERYESIVIDMPATGHTLALTGLPSILLRLIPVGPIATALKEGQSIINHPDRGAAWVVTLPEKLPVTEACELLEGLAEGGVQSGGVIVNRMPENPFTDDERSALKTALSSTDFGVLSLERIDAAARALEQLRTHHLGDVLLLPEVYEANEIQRRLTDEFSRLGGASR